MPLVCLILLRTPGSIPSVEPISCQQSLILSARLNLLPVWLLSVVTRCSILGASIPIYLTARTYREKKIITSNKVSGSHSYQMNLSGYAGLFIVHTSIHQLSITFKHQTIWTKFEFCVKMTGLADMTMCVQLNN